MAGDALLGREMGRYRIESIIGSGGFATVYRAIDLALERPVALKVVDPTAHRNPTIGRRFVLEGRAVASLDHPAIVPVFDAGETDGVLWMAMRLITGGSLDDALVAGRRFTFDQVAAVTARIGDALDHAHGHGVVHRDVKPSNILLEQNDPGRAWLADFGIAATTRTAGRYTTGALGTAAYMAPEQARPSSVGPPADLYSLGCVAYELLTRRRPFPGDDYVELLLAHATHPVPPTVWPRIDTFFQRALAKDPSTRPPSGRAFAQDLRRALDETDRPASLAPPPPAPAPSAPPASPPADRPVPPPPPPPPPDAPGAASAARADGEPGMAATAAQDAASSPDRPPMPPPHRPGDPLGGRHREGTAAVNGPAAPAAPHPSPAAPAPASGDAAIGDQAGPAAGTDQNSAAAPATPAAPETDPPNAGHARPAGSDAAAASQSGAAVAGSAAGPAAANAADVQTARPEAYDGPGTDQSSAAMPGNSTAFDNDMATRPVAPNPADVPGGDVTTRPAGADGSAPTVVEQVDKTLEHPAWRPPPPVHPPGGAPGGAGFRPPPPGAPPAPRDPTVVRSGRRRARRRLVAGGLVLVVGIVAVVVALIEQGEPRPPDVVDPAGILYDVPDGWTADDDNAPDVLLIEDGATMATVRHVTSDGRDAAAQLEDVDPSVCEDRADGSPADGIPGAEQVAMCTNTSAELPILALGAVAEGQFWLITLDQATTPAERDELLESIEFSAPEPTGANSGD